MKKYLAVLMVVAFVYVATSVHELAAFNGRRQVSINQSFEIALHETVQVGDYPIYIEYQAVEVDRAYIVYHHPFGTYTAIYTNGQTRNYSTAYMSVSSIDNSNITVYLSVGELPHAPGTNVRTPDGTIWFINNQYQRSAYTSAGAFLSYGFNSFSNVVEANSADLLLMQIQFTPPADGKVLCSDRGVDRNTCYLITDGGKVGFTSERAFKGLGYKFNRALTGDVSFLQQSGAHIDDPRSQHRSGTLINQGGTVLYVLAGGYVSFPSPEVFYSWGFSFEDVVPANDADAALVPFGVLSARQSGQLRPNL